MDDDGGDLIRRVFVVCERASRFFSSVYLCLFFSPLFCSLSLSPLSLSSLSPSHPRTPARLFLLPLKPPLGAPNRRKLGSGGFKSPSAKARPGGQGPAVAGERFGERGRQKQKRDDDEDGGDCARPLFRHVAARENRKHQLQGPARLPPPQRPHNPHSQQPNYHPTRPPTSHTPPASRARVRKAKPCAHSPPLPKKKGGPVSLCSRP